MEYEEIFFETKGHVATITFNRPERMNSFSPTMLGSAARAIKEVADNPNLRALVVTGTGRAFCAGADVKRMKSEQEAHGNSISLQDNQRLAHQVSLGLSRLLKPVIGAINGVAAGAGFEIALACDLRIAAASARFKEAAMGVGLVAGDGSAYFLPRIVGLAKAYEIMLLEDMIDSRRALELGLVNWVVPDEEFPAAVDNLAQRLADKAPIAMKLTKKSILDGFRLDLPDLLVTLLGAVEESRQTEDHLEGTRAYHEKRKPNFQAR